MKRNEEEKGEKKNWKSIIQWIVGGLFIISGIGNFSESPIASTMMLLAGVFILPITQQVIDEKYNIPSPLKYIALICWIVLTAFIGAQLQDGNIDEEQISKNKAPVAAQNNKEQEGKERTAEENAPKNEGDKMAVSGQASVYIPELNPTDVYLSLEEIGFTTEKDLGSNFGNFWTSTLNKGGIEYTVDVSSDDVNKVQSIRGTVINSNRNPDEVKQFFKYLVSSLFLHNNKSDSKVNNWIENNFNNDKATTSVGIVKIRILAPSKIVRTIRIDANLEDGM